MRLTDISQRVRVFWRRWCTLWPSRPAETNPSLVNSGSQSTSLTMTCKARAVCHDSFTRAHWPGFICLSGSQTHILIYLFIFKKQCCLLLIHSKKKSSPATVNGASLSLKARICSPDVYMCMCVYINKEIRRDAPLLVQ